jgi:hypothetical protein
MSHPKPIRIRNTAVPSIQMLYLRAAMRVKMLKHRKMLENTDKKMVPIKLETMQTIDTIITARR